jgi:hypothetical protein
MLYVAYRNKAEISHFLPRVTLTLELLKFIDTYNSLSSTKIHQISKYEKYDKRPCNSRVHIKLSLL